MAKCIIAILLAFLVFGSGAFADGMVVRPDDGYWKPYRQARQSAIINYENGYENLLLFVNTQGNPETEKFVWLFPVPAKPEQIEITNLKSFPSFSGAPLKQQFKNNLGNLALLNFVAVFPPAVLLFALMIPMGYSSGESKMIRATGRGYVDRGYEIWAHIDKYGISTEVMTAWDSAKFYHYLEVRGTNLAPEAKQRLEEYIGKDYSFVISWISNPEEYRQGTQNYYGYSQEPIGVFVRFPTEKIYYPMKLTSVYQDAYIPATIDVVGYKEPEIFSNISRETTTEFYYNDRLQYGLNEEESALKVFNGKIPEQLRFTRISINAQAKYFVQDLWISSNASATAATFETINSNWLLLAMLVFFALSFAAVFFVNKIGLGSVLDNRQMALLALSNFLTIFGFIAAVFVLKTQLKEKQKAKFRRLIAIPAFWAVFFGLSILFGILSLIIGGMIK